MLCGSGVSNEWHVGICLWQTAWLPGNSAVASVTVEECRGEEGEQSGQQLCLLGHVCQGLLWGLLSSLLGVTGPALGTLIHCLQGGAPKVGPIRGNVSLKTWC